nr:beta-glucosidase 4 GH3 family [Ipomoea batatas]
MASYSSWNGTQMHTSKFLLTDVLKGKLGFKGFIITDCAALDRLSNPFGSNYRRCVLAAINAGIDMVSSYKSPVSQKSNVRISLFN